MENKNDKGIHRPCLGCETLSSFRLHIFLSKISGSLKMKQWNANGARVASNSGGTLEETFTRKVYFPLWMPRCDVGRNRTRNETKSKKHDIHCENRYRQSRRKNGATIRQRRWKKDKGTFRIASESEITKQVSLTFSSSVNGSLNKLLPTTCCINFAFIKHGLWFVFEKFSAQVFTAPK